MDYDPRLSVRALPTLLALLALAAWGLRLPAGISDAVWSPVLYAADGSVLSARTATDQQWRLVPNTELPDKYIVALTTYEDRYFFRHSGVDGLAIARALRDNRRAGTVVSGGSTITMQLARLTLDRLGGRARQRTVGAKLREMGLALRMERRWSKTRILTEYAAHAPFGGNTVGLWAASLRYFGREVGTLSWAESALLAALPRNPSWLNLSSQRAALRERRDNLLRSLHAAGAFDRITLELALSEPLPAAPRPMRDLAPHLLTQRIAQDPRGTQRHLSTIDPVLQRSSAHIVRSHQVRLANLGAENAAVVIYDIASDRLLAYHGNFPAGGSLAAPAAFVDHASAPRSTGSVLKPVLFAAMLDAGQLLPGQLIADVPTVIGGFVPENHTRSYRGAVPAREALTLSLNVPLALLLRDYGTARLYDVLQDAGLSTLHRRPERYGLTLVLGGAEGRLTELTRMYAGMARAVLHSSAGDSSDFAGISSAAWWTTLVALQDVTRPGADSLWREYGGQPVSWKTGTSYGSRDAWAIGINGTVAIGVWVGNSDGRGAAGIRGSEAAAPLLFDLFGVAPAGVALPRPDDAVPLRVCSQSGLPARAGCPSRTEWVPQAAVDGPGNTIDRTVVMDAERRYRVHAGCPPELGQTTVHRMVLPPAMAWFYRATSASYLGLAPFHPECTTGAQDAGSVVAIAYPRDGAGVYIPREYGGEPGAVVLRAYHHDRRSQLHWHLDGTYLGSTVEIHQLEARPGRGVHTLTVVDERGNADRIRFEVQSDS